MNRTAQIDESLFDSAEAEHIVISSEPGVEFTQDTSAVSERSFLQASAARNEKRRFTIIDQRFLSVDVEQARSGRVQYQFNLAFLDPAPRRFSGVAWRWLYTSLALAGISTIAASVSLFSVMPLLGQRWLPVTVLLGAATIISLLVFIHRTRSTLTFRSVHGRAPLVEMEARNPDRAAVEDFVLTLQQHIAAARDAQWWAKPQFLRDELREHYRLWEEGVLAGEIYEDSKVRILAEHG